LTDSRVLITGARGQLGSDLNVLLAERGEVRAAGHEELNIADDAAVAAVMADLSPTLVVNCAAFHNVDRCEREEDRSFEVNARSVKRLAEACAGLGAKLVHFSTNYVFDGTSVEPYAEDDRPSPRSIYAISKLAGEYAALAYAPGALVVRTAGLYGMHGSESKGGNFVTRMLARAREQGALRMVADQRLTPTFTWDLARAVVEALDADADDVLHLTNSGECSWHEFTRAIMGVAGIDVPVEAVETGPGPGQVQRPRNGVLRSVRADALGLSPLRPWSEALADYMSRNGS
jgi:dTDP-4-dehydrorhamnose reductase